MTYEIFKKYLSTIGMKDTRTDSITDAVGRLHTAISKLDNKNYDLFMQSFGKTKGLLNAFAECEDLKKFD